MLPGPRCGPTVCTWHTRSRSTASRWRWFVRTAAGGAAGWTAQRCPSWTPRSQNCANCARQVPCSGCWRWTTSSSSSCGPCPAGWPCCCPTRPPHSTTTSPPTSSTSCGSTRPTTRTTTSSWPEGDLGVLADLGMPAAELQVIVDEIDLYPDEQLAMIAQRCGFADEFAEVLDKRPGVTASRPTRRWSRRPRSRRRGRRGPATSRSAPSSSTPTARELAARLQRPGGPRRPDRARRGAGPARGRRGRTATAGAWTAAPWRSPWSRARCARAPWCWPAWPASSSAPGSPGPAPSARSGTWSATAASTTAPRSSAASWKPSAPPCWTTSSPTL